MLTERQVYLPAILKMESSSELISTFDVGDISTEALMFQSGYLTLIDEENLNGEIFYVLGFTNREVRSALNSDLLGEWVGGEKRGGEHRIALLRALQKNDFARIHEIFSGLYAGIPHDWFRKNNIEQFEGYYASVFFASFAALGVEVIPEDVSNKGKLDMAVKFNGQVYLFEFKVVARKVKGSPNMALKQIKEKGYADKYRALQQPIHLIGVEFSKRTRNVAGFAVESADEAQSFQ
jgi:hypothetical protein